MMTAAWSTTAGTGPSRKICPTSAREARCGDASSPWARAHRGRRCAATPGSAARVGDVGARRAGPTRRTRRRCRSSARGSTRRRRRPSRQPCARDRGRRPRRSRRRRPTGRRRASRGDRVRHRTLVPGVEQLGHQAATDVAGGAGDEDQHGAPRFDRGLYLVLNSSAWPTSTPPSPSPPRLTRSSTASAGSTGPRSGTRAWARARCSRPRRSPSAPASGSSPASSGATCPLEYEIVECTPGRRLALHAETGVVVSHDVVTFTPIADGTRLDYDARLDSKGAARLFGPAARARLPPLSPAAAPTASAAGSTRSPPDDRRRRARGRRRRRARGHGRRQLHARRIRRPTRACSTGTTSRRPTCRAGSRWSPARPVASGSRPRAGWPAWARRSASSAATTSS